MNNQNPNGPNELYETQLSAPVQQTEKPATFPTPAHPLPRFLSRRAAIIFLCVIAMIFLVSISAGYFLGKNSNNPSLAPTISQTPTPTPDETANWNTYNSTCELSFKYPQGWKATKFFIENSESSCAYLTAPDYDSGLDSRDGFYMEIDVTKIGSYVNSVQFDGPPKDVQVNNLNDLVNATWSDLKNRPDILKQVDDKTYGSLTGKVFPTCCYESLNDFAFIHGDNIYEVKWPVDSKTGMISSPYGVNLNKILSTFQFTD